MALPLLDALVQLRPVTGDLVPFCNKHMLAGVVASVIPGAGRAGFEVELPVGLDDVFVLPPVVRLAPSPVVEGRLLTGDPLEALFPASASNFRPDYGLPALRIV